MRAYVVLGLFLAIPLASGTLQPHSEAQYWVESGIEISLLENVINDFKCATSEIYRHACAAALSSAREQIADPRLFLDDHFSQQLKQIAGVRENEIPKQMIYGHMLNAFVQAFDVHAHVVPTDYYRLTHIAESASYYGIGVRNAVTGSGLLIREVYANSPAEVAGLQSGDRIVKVAGFEIGTGDRARIESTRISGNPGDVLEIEVQRGDRRLSLRVPIGVVSILNVQAQVFSEQGKAVGYVRIGRFTHGTCQEVKTRISEMSSQVQGLVVDLRDNPGGLIDEALCLVGFFAGEVKAIGQKAVPVSVPLNLFAERITGNEPMDWIHTHGKAESDSLPLTILIDQGSASSAELLAAAVQDSGRAWLVGEKTFGKGTVQTAEPLRDIPGLTVMYTVSIFYRSNGTTNQLVGVTPDFEIPFRVGARSLERSFLREKDLYPGALQPLEKSSQWVQPRAHEVQKMKSCLGKISPQVRGDFQLDRGLALISCSAE